MGESTTIKDVSESAEAFKDGVGSAGAMQGEVSDVAVPFDADVLRAHGEQNSSGPLGEAHGPNAGMLTACIAVWCDKVDPSTKIHIYAPHLQEQQCILLRLKAAGQAFDVLFSKTLW